MTKQELREWRQRLQLTQAAAAAELGMTLRGYAKLEAGDAPIRRVVELATDALETRRTSRATAPGQ